MVSRNAGSQGVRKGIAKRSKRGQSLAMKRSALNLSFRSCAMALLTALLLGSCDSQRATSPTTEASKPATVEKVAPVEAPVEIAKPTPAVKPFVPQVDPVVEKKKETTPAPAGPVTLDEKKPMKEGKAAGQGKEVVTIGGGCFWCTEAVIERLEGVSDVVSGYMGGHIENPTYEQICTKTTGHAEVIEVTFDPAKISLEEILDVFWQAHDPTTLNQQGADSGPQYRSVIFYNSPEQKNIAMESMKKLNQSGKYPNPAVTEITAASKFWVAEEDHQNYYVLNKDKNPYCRIVISPKLKKLGME